MSNEKTIHAKCSKCNNFEEIVYNRNEKTFEDEIMSIDQLSFNFALDKTTVKQMLKILYNCFKDDVLQCKHDFKTLSNTEKLDNFLELTQYAKSNNINDVLSIDALDFYICANLKFIEDCFFFKRCSKCDSLLNTVLVYSV